MWTAASGVKTLPQRDWLSELTCMLCLCIFLFVSFLRDHFIWVRQDIREQLRCRGIWLPITFYVSSQSETSAGGTRFTSLPGSHKGTDLYVHSNRSVLTARWRKAGSLTGTDAKLKVCLEKLCIYAISMDAVYFESVPKTSSCCKYSDPV